ncbi:hypothetical protein GQ600_18696 [Phytophthora cactorum]|nr:hypothetical protein GQ600_18696 [Phytophthora cactorum]
MGHLNGKGAEKAFHILQTLKLTTNQREAILKLHVAKLHGNA